MMRLPTVAVCGTGWHWRIEGGKATRGSPPPDDATPLSSLLNLADFAAVATPHWGATLAAAPFTADEKAARALGLGVEGVTAAATVAAPAGHSMTDKTLAVGKEAEQVEVEVGVEVVPALPASPGRCEATVELTRIEAEGLLMLLADGQRTENEAAPEPASTSHTAAEAAVFSLLDLRQGSVAVAAPPPQPARPQSRPAPRAVPAPRPPPKSSLGGGGVVKRRGIADLATQFVCRHPVCGKAYGCPDAVRKHCRKEHSDWLRDRPNHGPEGYCSWEAGI